MSLPLSDVKAEVHRRIVKACAGNELKRCTTERARPKGGKWDWLSEAEFSKALNELRSEGAVRSVNGYWYVRGARPVSGGGR